MILPTWLYSKDGAAILVKDEESYNTRVAAGWKESPDQFKEQPIAQPTPQVVVSNNFKKGKRR